jgi:3D (Asp-Asp-Asp) domain-containing protein
MPFNSRVRFPEYFGEEIFMVTDRTHPRFGDRIDIWFPSREEALEFGKRRLKVEIWKY